METNTNKIFERLSKIKSTKETFKKEKMGAIEDAINQATDQVSVKGDKLQSITDELSQNIDDVVGQIESLKEGLSSLIDSMTNDWNSAQADFTETTTELDNIGVDYNNPFDELSNNWQDIIYYGDIVIKSQIN